jgi:hypothetical protein
MGGQQKDPRHAPRVAPHRRRALGQQIILLDPMAPDNIVPATVLMEVTPGLAEDATRLGLPRGGSIEISWMIWPLFLIGVTTKVIRERA